MIDKEKVREIIENLTKTKKDFEEVIASCISQREISLIPNLKSCAIHISCFIEILENILNPDKPVIFKLQ